MTAVLSRCMYHVWARCIHGANSQSITRAIARARVKHFSFSFGSVWSSALLLLFFFVKFFQQHLLVKMRSLNELALFFPLSTCSPAVCSHRIHLRRGHKSHRFVPWITIVSSIYVNWRLNWNFFPFVVVGVCVCAVAANCLRHSRFIYISISPSSMTTSSA